VKKRSNEGTGKLLLFHWGPLPFVFAKSAIRNPKSHIAPLAFALSLKLALPAQLNVFDFLFNRGEMPLIIPLGQSAPREKRSSTLPPLVRALSLDKPQPQK